MKINYVNKLMNINLKNWNIRYIIQYIKLVFKNKIMRYVKICIGSNGFESIPGNNLKSMLVYASKIKTINKWKLMRFSIEKYKIH